MYVLRRQLDSMLHDEFIERSVSKSRCCLAVQSGVLLDALVVV